MRRTREGIVMIYKLDSRRSSSKKPSENFNRSNVFASTNNVSCLQGYVAKRNDDEAMKAILSRANKQSW